MHITCFTIIVNFPPVTEKRIHHLNIRIRRNCHFDCRRGIHMLSNIRTALGCVSWFVLIQAVWIVVIATWTWIVVIIRVVWVTFCSAVGVIRIIIRFWVRSYITSFSSIRVHITLCWKIISVCRVWSSSVMRLHVCTVLPVITFNFYMFWISLSKDSNYWNQNC